MMSSDASVTTAAVAAESAINLAIAASLTGTVQQNVKFPLRCRMPGGERVIVNIEEENGKVDLNTATPDVLSRLFAALTRDQSAGIRIAGRIIEFRDRSYNRAKSLDPQSTDSKPDDEKKIGFTTIMQLDRIDGISPNLFKTALRFVTVHSGRPDPDKDAASPALRMLLNLDQNQTAPARRSPAAGSITVRADATAENGARFIREALVLLGSGAGLPFRILEWRHGDIYSRALTPQPRYAAEAAEDSCLRIGKAVGS